MTYLRSIGEVIIFLLLSIFAILDGIVRSFIPKRYKMKSIDGEIALVTGGGGGLGRLLSLRLANLGAIVIVWDINETGIEETVKLVRAAGGTCYGYVCDLCDRADIYKKAKIIREEVGKVTILINNAGIVTGMKFLDTPDKLIIQTMDVNVMSHFWTVKAFLPTMLENNKGHIVSVASLAGQCGIPKLVDYCTSKFAAMGFDEALRMELEYEGYDINTTVVCPYFIRSTGMFDDVQSRYIPTLSPNAVADRIIMAMRCNEKYAIIPGYLQILLTLKWIFPWPCVAMFLRGLVRDASPGHEDSKFAAAARTATVAEEECTVLPSKDLNSATIHQQLARRISSSERKP
ncbi:short-chain dehydrogenase/reductase family 16C member 6 [Temnothorax nylanderi]|uniref:short-chain dehydrogenase/reductase family 16C member 6 n=1 Tax=Temnothorax nylanderi TaxID=102681 RepID=UPI003A876ABA